MRSIAFGVCALVSALTVGACETAATGPAASTLHIERRVSGPDGGWDFVTFDPMHRRAYVARTNGVTAYDTTSGMTTPLLVAGSRTHIALPINDGAEILVTNGATGSAFIANAMTGAVRVPTIQTGSKPDSAMVEPVSGMVWVLDNDGGGITVVDPRSGAVSGTIAVPGALESPVTDGHGRVFITVEDLAEIVVLEARSRTVAAHWPLADCEGPTGLALDQASQRLVAECANGSARIVSSQNGAAIASIPLGPRPDELAYDGRRHLVYAPSAGDGMMSIIDPARARVIASVTTQVGCRGAAVDTATGRLFLPAGRFTANPTPGGRPVLTPGSFEILVMAP